MHFDSIINVCARVLTYLILPGYSANFRSDHVSGNENIGISSICVFLCNKFGVNITPYYSHW